MSQNRDAPAYQEYEAIESCTAEAYAKAKGGY